MSIKAALRCWVVDYEIVSQECLTVTAARHPSNSVPLITLRPLLLEERRVRVIIVNIWLIFHIGYPNLIINKVWNTLLIS